MGSGGEEGVVPASPLLLGRARPASGPVGDRGLVSGQRPLGLGQPPGAPAGRVGRGRCGRCSGPGESERASEAPAGRREGGREGASRLLSCSQTARPGWLGGDSARETRLDPPVCGVGEVKASVNRRRLCLPAGSCSLPQPLRRSPSPAQWLLRRLLP